ncbi:alcohol oxidase [Thozetella sp. PMI_491]|nr:alcohol oxidase [Thozetella sp. PMI_491]
MLWIIRKATLALVALYAVRAGCQQYDYIVVGSGPGGGPLAADLARAGQSVLLLEAGSDLTNDPEYVDPFLATVADNDARSRWDFFVKHSDDPARELKYEHLTWRTTNGSLYVGLNPPAGSKELGVWYPRAAVLGGCAMHNAAFFEMPTDDYWDDLADITDDDSWRSANIRKVFTSIENCHYEPNGTAGHGFKGWLDSNQGPDTWLDNNTDGAALLQTFASLTNEGRGDLSLAQLKAISKKDMNAANLSTTNPLGIFGLVFHTDAQGNRASPANYILKTLQDPAKYPLTVQLNALATKINWAPRSSSGQTPVATGVSYVVGQSAYQADPRYDATKKPVQRQATARKEVIIAGGVFNTPQLLKLSGVGPAAELNKFKIPVVANLPGVGKNLRDNYETSVISQAARAPGNLGWAYEIYLKTSQSQGPRDIFMWAFNGGFQGFWPGFPPNLGPNATTFSIVHMGSENAAGDVKLRSADPTEPPEINFRYFSQGGAQDLQAMLEAVNFAEKVKNKLPANLGLAPFQEVFPCPGSPSNCTDAVKKENIKLQAWSHHATGTCAMGDVDDDMTVVDSAFRVKGVKGLRVVDGSIFPKPPGAFPVLSTFILSRKAAGAILNRSY